jgi:hypothetical protein|tara:strand:- start:468 stop:617 length:150 start_codon:yes stop_codon:yes gene_type:complete
VALIRWRLYGVRFSAMAASQDILLVRRKYNQWAGEQAIEDFVPRVVQWM